MHGEKLGIVGTTFLILNKGGGRTCLLGWKWRSTQYGLAFYYLLQVLHGFGYAIMTNLAPQKGTADVDVASRLAQCMA